MGGRLKVRKGWDPRIIPNSDWRINSDRETGPLENKVFGFGDVFPNPRRVGGRRISGEKRLRGKVFSR